MTSNHTSIPSLVLVFLVLSIVSLPMAAFADGGLVQLPTLNAEGEDREVTVLVDQSDLKLATITLRRGTILPTHSAPVPATIQVVEGRGVIHVGEEAVAVTAGSIIVLAAGEAHDVVPEADSDMLLVVHYLRSAADCGPDDSSESAHDHKH